MSEAHKEVMRLYWEEAINKGNYSVLEEVADPNYVLCTPGQELHGVEDLKGLLASYRTAFPDAHLEIDDMVFEGDKVVTCFTVTGTHKGDLTGIAPTGKQVKFSGMILSRFENGKIVEEWEILDQLTMLQQLGVVSSPA
ncbi:MAG: ester cyclase [Candidatus Thiosymbion ectosymbiont of Robbea hypermnestra]|nr:ester cyclase [Candidatus Thiosymbion ectosymbiont of Robbea hypermnestra]